MKEIRTAFYYFIFFVSESRPDTSIHIFSRKEFHFEFLAGIEGRVFIFMTSRGISLFFCG